MQCLHWRTSFQASYAWLRLPNVNIHRDNVPVIALQNGAHSHPLNQRKMYNSERTINVQRGEQNVVDTEFDSMRERFESEMHRVEAEMARLRAEFESEWHIE